MKWYLHALKNTFNYQGRARRAEFGWFYLVNFLLQMAMLVFISMMIAMPLTFGMHTNIDIENSFASTMSIGSIIFIAIWGLYQLLMLFTTLSLTARRLHDLGWSGWWQLLIYTLPFLYAIIIVAAEMLFNPLDDGSMGNSASFFGLIMVLGNLIVASLSLIFFVVLLFKDGQRFENKYGADPKAQELAKLLEAAQKLKQQSETISRISQRTE